MNYYWCTEHDRVETDDDKCPGNRVLGPYRSRGEAQSAIQRIAEREARQSEEDARWSDAD